MVDAALISGLLNNLAPLLKDEVSLCWNFNKDVCKLSYTISFIDDVLEEAEMKAVRDKDKQTADWLRKLKRVAYEVRDVMDDCTLQDLRLQLKTREASSSTRVKVTNFIALPFSKTWTRLKIGHKIKDVRDKLDQIYSECSIRHNLQHLPQSTHASQLINFNRPETMSLFPSENLYGRDEEQEKIIKILVGSSNVANGVSVLPILGLGGLGKTALAQTIYNNEVVTNHFDENFWVCVSEVFDEKLIIKAIIGATPETSLDILKNKLQEKLKGKRYFLVLDDVWNEDTVKWEKMRAILNCGSNGSFILTTTRKKIVAERMQPDKILIFDLSPISPDDCWQLIKEKAFSHGIQDTPDFVQIGKEIAKKCKGVPLIAKTLGAQLGLKNDVNQWRRIRDNEIWKISENEESILPILKLSYYDLKYHLRRCFAICAIFPKDAEIEKESLIELWMAHDLIPKTADQELEDHGSNIWNELMWRSLFQVEKLNHREGVSTCKMHDLMHDLARSVMKDECYTLDGRSSSKDFEAEPEIRHLTIAINELEEGLQGSFKELEERLLGSFKKNKGGLQSIIFHRDYGYGETDLKEIFSASKELSSLRVLDVPEDHVQSLDLRYLKHLRYLNLSGNTTIKTLPNGICDLLNLLTLNLKNCSSLESLPRNTKDLINLRHLHLKGCRELKYMPRGMGQLRNLKTLRMFLIGKESEGGLDLDEIKKLDIGGYLEIKNLERVSDECIKKGISMSKMSRINELELYWGDEDASNDEKKSRHEKIGEALEVSSRCVWRLKMEGYKGENMPKWVGESCASSLKRLELEEMENVQHIFTMNTSSSSSEIGMVDQLFPLLEIVYIRNMRNLRELVSPPPPIPPVTTTSGVVAFPSLWWIEISNCPKLGALPAHLKSLTYVSVWGECCEELLDSIISNNQSCLTSLSLINNGMDERRVLVGGGSSSSDDDVDVVLFPLLEILNIKDMKNLRELVSVTSTVAGALFPNLREIWIDTCPKLGALPPCLKSLTEVIIFRDCCDELLESIISNQRNPINLSIGRMDERRVLFPGAAINNNNKDEASLMIDDDEDEITRLAADNINEAQAGEAISTFQSLRSLKIDRCPTLRCLFDEEEEREELAVGGGGQRERERRGGLILTNLSYLEIRDCPELRISVEQWRNLITSPSLQIISISNCPNVVPSEGEEADQVIALLGSRGARLRPDFCFVDFQREERDED